MKDSDILDGVRCILFGQHEPRYNELVAAGPTPSQIVNMLELCEDTILAIALLVERRHEHGHRRHYSG